MKKNIIIYLAVVGLIGLLSGCKKDETKVVMLTNPIAPTIKTVPDLTLSRTHATDTLTFAGTAVDAGFQASVTYILEVCPAGNGFVNAITLLSGGQDLSMKITVSDLNGILLKKFDGDVASSVDMRIRAILTTDVGTGVKSYVYSSEVKTLTVTPYGLPRLDLVNSGIDQKIESALGNGTYTGFVKLDAAKAFTLKDPDANIIYGDNAGALAVNGSGISVDASGWYKLTANTIDLTYSKSAYMIGLVGSATPNGWNSPDQKMDYDAKTGTWHITIDLVAGDIKFRLNDGWAWNLGGTPDNLTQGGANITLAAGNYTITLTIIGGTTGTCTIVKN